MKCLKYIIIFLVAITCNNLNAQIPDLCYKIDSIYILSIDYNVFFSVNVPRAKFEDYLSDMGKFDIVRDHDKIEDICKILNDLTPDESNNCKPTIKVITKHGIPRFIDTDIIDVRSLLVLYMQNNQTLVWTGLRFTEYDCKLYYTSEKLYSYLENYKYKYSFEKSNYVINY